MDRSNCAGVACSRPQHQLPHPGVEPWPFGLQSNVLPTAICIAHFAIGGGGQKSQLTKKALRGMTSTSN